MSVGTVQSSAPLRTRRAGRERGQVRFQVLYREAKSDERNSHGEPPLRGHEYTLRGFGKVRMMDVMSSKAGERITEM